MCYSFLTVASPATASLVAATMRRTNAGYLDKSTPYDRAVLAYWRDSAGLPEAS